MKRVISVIGLLLLLSASARAVCTQHGVVGTSSTQIVLARDINPRSYMLIENSGTNNNMWVAIGSSNNATVNDTLLKPGASWLLTAINGTVVPASDVAAISTNGGTSYAFCDY